MKKKRIIITIVVILVAVLGIGTGLFFYSKNKTVEDSSKKDAKEKQEAVEETEPEKTPEELEAEEIAKLDVDSLPTLYASSDVKFRKEASTDADVIETIKKDTEVKIIEEGPEWNKVLYNNHLGYVFNKYLYTADEKAKAEEAAKAAAEAAAASGSYAVGSVTRGSNGYVVCIDPGHQRNGDSTQEANGPGSSTMKARVTGGTTGRTTGIPEYQEVLTVGLLLQQELSARGYTVAMTRTSHDVNISNKERAEYATNVGANATVRLHCNGVENTSTSGALTMAPSTSNPYCSGIASASQSLARCVIDNYCSATGMNNQGVSITDTMTGMNWCTSPVCIIEMGYMTNPTDDTNLNDPNFQTKMVQGIANGIDAYFGL